MENAKNCPFCGEHNLYVDWQDSYFGAWYYVGCHKCDSKGPSVEILYDQNNSYENGKEKAIEAWNERK